MDWGSGGREVWGEGASEENEMLGAALAVFRVLASLPGSMAQVPDRTALVGKDRFRRFEMGPRSLPFPAGPVVASKNGSQTTL